MAYTGNIEYISIPKDGEAVSGDTIIVHRSPQQILVVLSDGVDSGIAASVTSILASEIWVHCNKGSLSSEESLRLFARTLPPSYSTQRTYATITAIAINRISSEAIITTMGNPPVLFFRNSLERHVPPEITTYEHYQFCRQKLFLQPPDSIVAMTDGFRHSFSNNPADTATSFTSLSYVLSNLFTDGSNGYNLKQKLFHLATSLTEQKLHDDASLVIIQSTPSREVTILIGPPISKSLDEIVVQRFLSADGKKIICGGTTSKIVSLATGIPIHPLPHTAGDGVPPYATMDTIDLVTEGILTVAKAIQYLATPNFYESIPLTHHMNGAFLLAKELLEANFITFLVGTSPHTQESALDITSSSLLRKSLVRQCATLLAETYGKEVFVDYY